MHNNSEKMCKIKATILQGHSFNLFFIKDKIRPMISHVNKAILNKTKIFPAVVVFSKVKKARE